MNILLKTTIIASILLISTNAMAKNNVDGIYTCKDKKKDIILTIKDNIFDMIDGEKKLSSILVPKIENPSKMQQQLSKSSKLTISNDIKDNIYKLSLKMSYKANNKEEKHFNKELGIIKKNKDGSLTLSMLKSEINCIKQ